MDEILLDSEDSPVFERMEYEDQASKWNSSGIEEKIVMELNLEVTETAEIRCDCLVPSASANIAKCIQHPPLPPIPGGDRLRWGREGRGEGAAIGTAHNIANNPCTFHCPSPPLVQDPVPGLSFLINEGRANRSTVAGIYVVGFKQERTMASPAFLSDFATVANSTWNVIIGVTFVTHNKRLLSACPFLTLINPPHPPEGGQGESRDRNRAWHPGQAFSTHSTSKH